MSYEGHEQHICANGHLFEIDCQFDFSDAKPGCPDCNAKSSWVNYVDDTNCEAVGVILNSEFEKLLISPAKYETCNLGHKHLIESAKYHFPTEHETELVRSFLAYDNKYYPLSEYSNPERHRPIDNT